MAWIPAVLATMALAAFDRTKALCACLASLADWRASNIGDPWQSILAARSLLQHPHPPLYRDFSGQEFSFIYPPIAAWLMLPLATKPYPALQPALSLISRSAYLVCVVVTFLLARRAGTARAALVTLLLALGFYPLLRAVELNQATLLVSACLGVALLAALRGLEATAGALIGVTAALKPQAALVLLLCVWHSRRLVWGGLGAMACTGALSLATAGIADHVDYATRVIPSLSAGYAFYPNQSWTGVILRLAGEPMFSGALPSPSWSVRAVTLAASLATLATAFICLRAASRHRAPTPDGLVHAIGFAWLSVTLASPISWEHHFTPCMFFYAFMVSTWRSWSGPSRVAAIASLPLVAGYIATQEWGGYAARIASSYCFAGGVMLTVAYGMSLRERLASS